MKFLNLLLLCLFCYTPSMANQLAGHFLALLTAFCWAENSVIWGNLSMRTSSEATAHLRMWIALPFMVLIAYLFEGWTALSLRTWVLLLLSGSLGYFVTDMLMFASYASLGPQKSMAIMTLNPALTAIFSFFLFGQKLSIVQTTGLVVTLLGVLLLTTSEMKTVDRHDAKAKGILFALFGALFQSLSFLLTKFALAETGPFTTNMVRSIGGTASLFLYALCRRKMKADFTAYSHVPRRYVALLFLGSLLGPLLGMSMEMKAFTLATLGTVTAITQASPVILLIQESLIGHKRFTALSVIATLTSTLGIALLFLPF